MKTERVTLLASPEFKDWLTAEAQNEGVSVSELVRTRCERGSTGDEKALAALVAEVGDAVRVARSAVNLGIAQAQAALLEIRADRAARDAKPAARRTRPRKTAIAA